MIDLKLKPHSASRESSQKPFMSLLGGWGLREGSEQCGTGGRGERDLEVSGMLLGKGTEPGVQFWRFCLRANNFSESWNPRILESPKGLSPPQTSDWQRFA